MKYRLAPRHWADAFRFKAPGPFVGFLQRVSVTLHIERGGWGNAATENNDSWWRAAHKEKKGLGTRSLTVSLRDEHCRALTWRMVHNHVAPGPIRTEDALLRVSLSYTNACWSNKVAAECESTLRTFCHWVDHGLRVINKLHNHHEWVVLLLLAPFWQMAPTKVCLGW